MMDMMQAMMGNGSVGLWAWPMLFFMGLFWILILVLMVLAIIWLIKQIKK